MFYGCMNFHRSRFMNFEFWDILLCCFLLISLKCLNIFTAVWHTCRTHYTGSLYSKRKDSIWLNLGDISKKSHEKMSENSGIKISRD